MATERIDLKILLVIAYLPAVSHIADGFDQLAVTIQFLAKGADMRIGVAPMKDYTLIDDDKYGEEIGVGYMYLRRIIEECRARGKAILLVHLPHLASERAQMSANTVGSIAEEYGVDYIDFVRMDSVVDYAADCYDSSAHLNPSGGWKVTDYIGQYLSERYGLSDCRSDPAYAHWQAAR